MYSYGGKSGKSGGEGYEGEGYEGKSGKSGGYGSYEGKSSKGSIYEQVCLTPEPIPPTPPSIDIPPPPAPSDDTCIISVVTIDGELVCSNGEYPTADGYGDMAFINFKTCCNTLSAEGGFAADEECPIVDECGVLTDPPAPTPDTCIISVVTIDGELVCSNGEYPIADGYGDMAFPNFQTCCSTLRFATTEECPIKDECGVLTDPPVPTPVETYEPTTGGSTGSTPTVATEAVSDIVDMGPRL